jgi:hypothetical protein
MSLGFLKDFKKSLAKMETIVTDFSPPRFWYSTGNLALNKVISGSFTKGIPQGRVTALAGPSGCLPADEVISVYVFKTDPGLAPEIKKEV